MEGLAKQVPYSEDIISLIRVLALNIISPTSSLSPTTFVSKN